MRKVEPLKRGITDVYRVERIFLNDVLAPAVPDYLFVGLPYVFIGKEFLHVHTPSFM
jgi:hypothetical protein